MCRKNHHRRGVVLLVTLSLLILFLLIGITYVLTSGQFKRSASVAAKAGQFDDNPNDTLHEAIYELLRGSNSLRSSTTGQTLYNYACSSIAGASILENMYDDYAAKGTLASVAADGPSKGQFINVSCSLAINPAFTKIGKLANYQTSGFFNGCVLTVVSGQAAGASTRIVGYSYANGAANLTVMPFDTDFPVLPKSGNNILINSRQFSGTGPGYDHTTGKMDKKDTGRLLAFIPNAAATANYLTLATEGGMNVDYNAADYNTFFLSYSPAINGQPTIPSFHRPALLEYWNKTGGGLSDDVLRRAMLRPNKADHPIFYATVNPGFNPINGPWDVDNDGEGIPDSIWVDVGFPPMMHKDGRIYKPLVAYLVRDMDGRLNLNVHGSITQTLLQQNSTKPQAGPYAGGVTPSTSFPRGLGVGPPEINPAAMLTDQELANVLGYPVNGAKPMLEGRYGADGTPGAASMTLSADALTKDRLWDFPPNYYKPPSPYASPPDLDGRGFVALDVRGQPLFSTTSNATFSFMGMPYDQPFYSTDPYRVNYAPYAGSPGVLSGATVDNLFTTSDLETLLRWYDIDALSLSTRLVNLKKPAAGVLASAQTTTGVGKDEDRRLTVTTHSFAVPAPSALPTSDMRTKGLYQTTSIVDLVKWKLQQHKFTGDVNRELSILLPRELVAGVPMNINRASSVANDDLLITNPASANAPNYVPQIEARQLYVLLMLLADEGYLEPFTEVGLTDPQKKELTARRLAQWAINAACFKDPDAIMRPFVYQLDPFSGWTSNGDPAQVASNQNLRVVWACRPPQLLLMESIAFHDRRVADTDEDDHNIDPSDKPTKPGKVNQDQKDTKNPPDTTLDSVRVPQGSLYTKLYCPTNTNNPPGAGFLSKTDLYTTDASTGKVVLNLEMLDKNTQTDPVWRMAISMPSIKDQNSLVAKRLEKNPDSISLQPENMGLVPGAAQAPVVIDRYVWFTSQKKPAATGLANVNNTYYGRNAGTAYVDLGGYAVVGPRARTFIGAGEAHVKGATTHPSDQSIELSPTSVKVNGAAKLVARGIICGADAPAGWDWPYIGINASEPLRNAYYDKPTKVWKNWKDEYDLTKTTPGYSDAYGDGTSNTYRDTPEDDTKGDLKANNALATGTYAQYRTIFLQRLADPNRPFDQNANPYITVDWMPTDLTVYNGEDQFPTAAPGFIGKAPWDPDDPKAPDVSAVAVVTRQRGYDATYGKLSMFGTAAGTTVYNNSVKNDPTSLWPAVTDDPDPTKYKGTPPNATHNFSCPLKHAFATLNDRTYGAPVASPPDPTYAGSPSKPFPWLTFNNRPYVSAHELLLVPASSPSRLTTEFSLPAMAAAAVDPYNPAAASARGAYGHLLNFWQANSQTSPPPSPQPVGNFFRLFEYVGVSSKFTGAETWLDPTTFQNVAGFRPPYNAVSNYRDPGLVNINTINSQAVWQAVLNNYPGPTWAQLVKSRSIYDSGAYGTTNDGTYPTNFAGAYRSATGADFVPPVPTLARQGVDATLLRRDPAAPTRPLFSMDPTKSQALNEPTRNPYFAFQGIDRLSNLVTTRSNVFAVWVTVGYFECLPYGKAPDAYHPDGYQLGAELDSDVGNVKRHRAFYIIDRSIPVGFERGQDHNDSKTILLQRYIE